MAAVTAHTTKIGEAILSPGELAWLLSHFKLSVGRDSFFCPVLNITPDRSLRGRLERDGLLTDAWRTCLGLITTGKAQFTVREVMVDAVSTGIIFIGGYGTSSTDVTLALKTAGGDFHLTHSLTPSDLLARLTEKLNPVGTTPPAIFDKQFSAAGLSAFAAAVDFVRTVIAASLVQRTGLGSIQVRRTDLETQIRAGLEQNDNRALFRLFCTLLPHLAPVQPGEFGAGIRELVDADLLAPADDPKEKWFPQPALLSIAYDLMSPIPTFALARATPKNDPDTNLPLLIVMRGNALWHVEVRDNAPGVRTPIRVRSLDGLASLTELQGILERHPAEAKDVEQPSTQAPDKRARPCPKCGTSLSHGKKFCTNCGAPVMA